MSHQLISAIWRAGIYLPLLMTIICPTVKAFGQSSPVPEISSTHDYPHLTPSQGFCMGEEIVVIGNDLITVDPSEVLDSIAIYLSGGYCQTLHQTPLASPAHLIRVQLPPNSGVGNFILEAVKTTHNNTNTFTYVYTDTLHIWIGADSAFIDYGQDTFCLSGPNPVPFSINTTDPNGRFFSTSSLIVDSISGEILMYNGAVGTGQTMGYRTTDLYCPDTFRISLDILSPGSSHATIYNSTMVTLCGQDTIIADTSTLYPKGGKFICQNQGLIILDDSSGMVDLSQSTPGLYSVRYAPAALCFDTATIMVLLTTPPVIDYGLSSGARICRLAPPLTPAFLAGPGGGTFIASPGGLMMGQNDGRIEPGSSNPGWYQISYILPGVCSDTVVVLDSIEIKAMTSAFFSLGTTFVCSSVDTLPFTSVLNPGGITTVYHGNSIQLQYSGEWVPISALQPGRTYDVQYIAPASSGCPDTMHQIVTIGTKQTAVLDYGIGALDTVCSNSSLLSPVFLSGPSGGIYTPFPSWMVINANGIIDPGSTPSGTYGLLYTPPGPCAITDTVFTDVTFEQTIDAGFTFPTNSICALDSSITINPVISGGHLEALDGSVWISNGTSPDFPVAGTLSPNPLCVFRYSTRNLGFCGDTSTQILSITAPATATVEYGISTGDTICSNQGPIQANFISGLSNGDFRSSPGGIYFSQNGNIQTNSSTSGQYDIYYIPPGGCRDTVHIVDSVYLSPPAFAYFTLDHSSICISEDSLFMDSVTIPGGTVQAFHTDTLVHSGIPPAIPVSGTFQSNVTYDIVYITSHRACPDTAIQHVSTMAADTANLTYGLTNPYIVCQRVDSLVPSIQNGLGGGIFQAISSSAANLHHNATGTIYPAASDTGTFIFLYIPPGSCPHTDTIFSNLVIAPVDSVDFELQDSLVCSSVDSVELLHLTPANGDLTVWSGTSPLPNMTTIPLPIAGHLPHGVYTIQYTSSNHNCPHSKSIDLKVVQQELAEFRYADSLFCINDSQAFPVSPLTTPGGTFSSSTAKFDQGFSTTSQTGIVNIPASGLGIHEIWYFTSGVCNDTHVVEINIFLPDSADFDFDGQSPYCSEDSILKTDYIASANGIFLCGDTLLEWANLDSGWIDLVSTPAGQYTIERVIGGSCGDRVRKTISIQKSDNTSFFSYPDSAYCGSDTTGQAILSPGFDLNRVFTITPSGPTIDPFTGNIDFSDFAFPASGKHTTTITCDFANECAADPDTTITVYIPPTFNFGYPGGPYCEGPDTLTPNWNITGIDGLYSTSSPLLPVDTNGIVYTSGVPYGDYIVRFETPGKCPAKDSARIQILPFPEGINLIATPVDGICYGETMDLELQQNSIGESWLSYRDTTVYDKFWFGIEGLHDQDTIWGYFRNQYECIAEVYFIVSVHPPPALYGMEGQTMVIGEELVELSLSSTLDSTHIAWTNSTNGFLQDSGLILVPYSGLEGSLSIDPEKVLSYQPTRMELILQPFVGKCYGNPDTLNLLVLPEPGPIFLPEVFTPNGDGLNDTWNISWGPEIDPCDHPIEVYNRPGRMVFRTECLNSGWNAEGLSDGVYKWIMRSPEGTFQRAGMVTIRRK